MDTDWHAIALAALRSEYPRLPDQLPDAVAALVGVLVARMESASPGVTSQMVGAYSVVYSAGGQAIPLTAMEAMVLRPYKRSTVKSVRTPSTLSREFDPTGETRWDLRPEQADYLGVFDNEDAL